MWNLDFTPYLWPMAFSALLPALILIAISRRPLANSTWSVVTVQLALIEWTLAGMLVLMVPDLATKSFFVSVAYVGITITAMAWFIFTLEYTDRGHWVTRRFVLLLLIEPVLAVLANFTNPLHELFRHNVRLDPQDGFSAFASDQGVLFWAHAVYSYALLATGFTFLLRAYQHTQPIYRAQIRMLLVGAIAPWIANALFILQIISIPIDITPFAFAVTALTMGFSILRYRFLEIVPVARAKVFESIHDGVIVLDPQHLVVDINPAARALIGAEGGQMQFGTPGAEILQRIGLDIARIVDMPSSEIEITVGEAESARNYLLQVTRLTDQNDIVTGRVLVLRDITDLRKAARQVEEQYEQLKVANAEAQRARQEAERANELKSQFLTNMSHELRTPLNAIVGYTQLQVSGMAGEIPPRAREFQERTLVNARDLLRLINDLLDVSKIEAGRMELITKPFDVRAMLDEILEQSRVLAQEKGLDMKLELEERLTETVVGDRARLKQVIVNLVSNAVKFTPEGSVTLRAEPSTADSWRVIVSDTGIGIPTHMHDVIFEEFRQTDAGKDRQYGGTGLGLSIARRLVVMMGGSINVKSQVGEGSQFIVTLPIAIQTGTEEEQANVIQTG